MEIDDFKEGVIKALKEKGLNTLEREEVLSGDNTVFGYTSESVGNICELTPECSLEYIKKQIEKDFGIQTNHMFEYLFGKKFREKYFQDEKMQMHFKNLFNKKIPNPKCQKDSWGVQEFNKLFKKLKERIDFGEVSEDFYINNIKASFKKVGVNTAFDLHFLGTTYLTKYHMGNFPFRISLKKVFGNPRVRDIPHKDLIGILGLVEKDEYYYKQVALSRINQKFRKGDSLGNDSARCTYTEDEKSLLYDNLGAKYFFHKICLATKDSKHMSPKDFTINEINQFLNWCGYS